MHFLLKNYIMKKLGLLLIVITMCVLLLTCSKNLVFKGGPYYYDHAEWKATPSLPVDRISEEEAFLREKSGTSYVIVYYNDESRIESVVLRGEKKDLLTFKYYYKDGKLVKRISINSTGEKRSLYY